MEDFIMAGQKISLLYESNKKNLVAVKTAAGMTDRVNIPTIVQQGGTWGPLLCSNSVDTLGKMCKDRGEHFYTYKNAARVFPLAFVDDLNGIAKCGFESDRAKKTQISCGRQKWKKQMS